MSFLTTGETMEVMVNSISLEGDVIKILVTDTDGCEYVMVQAQPPRQAQAAPAPQAGPGQAQAAQAAQAAPQGPSQAQAGGEDQAPDQDQGGHRPREYDSPESIAIWLAVHPEDMRFFAPKLTLKIRQMVADIITELLDADELETARHALFKFTQVDPPPEFSGDGATWGYEGSPVASNLHEGQLRKNLEREPTNYAKVDSRLGERKVKGPKGNTLDSGKASSDFKNWSAAALGDS